MAKPRLIILVRHGQSEGNKNREIHQTVPDHRVKLTSEGWNQAREAGRRLRNLLRPDDKLHFFTSPYRRTRETTEGILQSLTCNDSEPSPFQRPNIKVYEEPRLREQDFGNFQPCSAEMERMWQERADYGHFFYRIPNGESAADAYDRISGFNESLWRQFGEDDFASVCVLVTHGLMSRVFLMKWYHFTVEYFEDLRNINHCEFLIMRKEDNGKYKLENELRTWTQLREMKEKEKEERERAKDALKLQRTKTFIVTRRWGGCPNGCNHSNHYKRRDDLELLRQKDVEHGGPAPYGSSGATNGFTNGITNGTTNGITNGFTNGFTNGITNGGGLTIATRRQRPPQVDASADIAARQKPIPAAIDTSLLQDDDSSPENTSSFISADELEGPPPPAHLGRDGGGTYSGNTSIAGSDSDASSEDDNQDVPLHKGKKKMPTADDKTDPLAYKEDDDDDVTGTEKHRRTNRLGDASPDSSEEGDPEDHKQEDLDAAEIEDRSIRGSVY